MNSDIMSIDNQLVTQNNGIYGSNRINYILFVMGLCGAVKTYATNGLAPACHKSVTYDLAQEFPEDQLTAALLSTQTELPQVQGIPNTFEYAQSAEAVEFIISSLAGVDTTNVDAGIIKQMLRKYDYQSWEGANGNVGFKTNANTTITLAVANDGSYAAFKTALDSAIQRMRADIGLTREQWSSTTVAFNEPISVMLGDTVAGSDLSNWEKLNKAYPEIMFRELPDNLQDNSLPVFTVSYAPMLTFHRASIPSKYNEERGKHGLSVENLYCFESMAVEVEESGAAQYVEMVAPPAMLAAAKAAAKAKK